MVWKIQTNNADFGQYFRSNVSYFQVMKEVSGAWIAIFRSNSFMRKQFKQKEEEEKGWNDLKKM